MRLEKLPLTRQDELNRGPRQCLANYGTALQLNHLEEPNGGLPLQRQGKTRHDKEGTGLGRGVRHYSMPPDKVHTELSVI